ncbi:MAG: hypothetical protein GY722_09685 [bacterium]|nr:hypothetical protein [bacterium]
MSWPRQKLESLASDEPYSFVGGPFGSKLTSRDYVPDGVPVIRGSNLNDGRFLGMDDFVFVSESKAREDLAGNLAKPGDLIFTQRGTLGQVALVPENGTSDRYVVSQSQMKLTVDEAKAAAPYLYYYFSSREALARILNLTSSSGVPHINLTTLRNFKVPVPPLHTQKVIASVLSAYDGLIENNRRRIQLLDQAARLLYKEWFVHLRFPGHEHVSVVNGVPEGWSEGMVSDFYSTSSGGTPSRKIPDYYTGTIPWVKTRELTGNFILSTEERITRDAINRSSAKLFPRHSVLIAMYGATIGQSAILAMPATTNQACCAVISKEPGTSHVHASLFFSHHKPELLALGQGAAQKNISQKTIKSFRMVLPKKQLLGHFYEAASPLLDQIETLEKTSINLAKARDLLLPRLMNGEIPA